MIKQTRYCDRCGRECGEWRNNNGFHIFRHKLFMKDTRDNDYLDLCQICYDSLEKWMKEPE